MPKKPAPKSITLNEEQREAVNFGAGYACLLAGPGSGKTLVNSKIRPTDP